MIRLLRWLVLVLALATAPVLAQTLPGAMVAPGEDEATLSYDDWDRMAIRAEAELANRNTTTERLEELRGYLAKWRAALLNQQSANSSRIATLREQLAALGPPPEEGQTEADEISTRRKELNDVLVQLQAPGIAAEEAYRRASGLITEIDRVLRERQAEQLLQLWPSPANPGNWPEAAIGLTDTMLRLWDEGASAWTDPDAREELLNNLPLILSLLAVAFALVVYVRRWIEGFALRLRETASARGRNVWSLLASTGGVVLPTLGVLALAQALVASGMLGEIGASITASLPLAGFIVFAAAWLGARAFPVMQDQDSVLPLPAERRAEARFLAVLMGLVLAADQLRGAAMDAQAYSDATTAVMSFPILVTGGLIVLRLGRVLRRAPDQADRSYALRLLLLLSRGLSVIGILGPALAALGYVQAASALIYPAIISLGLITLLFILQGLIADIWAMILRNDGEGRDGLVPVLAGFAMTLASLPVFALVWGARRSDITELWTRFTEGFQMGETRISPTDFIPRQEGPLRARAKQKQAQQDGPE